jgi:cell division protein FtsI/penicillin-binding protein 2
MNFDGSRYTLYKGQIKDTVSKRSNKISFIDSFAQSVNPVFGKLGTFTVGKTLIEKYATAFGFNHRLDFEAPVPASEITVSAKPFELAEIASGFNRITQISPLHGALLSGTIVNNGQFTEPTIIDQIVDDKGNIIYSGSQLSSHQAIRPETSSVLRQLMASTITSGTGRKSFDGFMKDPVLNQLNIGGKTCSIDNNVHDVRFDWFVGFAAEKNGDQKLSLCVLVGHEKYIGTKACYYARMAMKHYFGNQFAKNDVKRMMAIR